MRTPEQIVIDALAVADGGLTQTALVRILSAARVRVSGRRPTGPSVRALLGAASLPDHPSLPLVET